MIYLVDTGILLRAVDRQAPEFEPIQAAFRALRGRGDILTTSTQNLREFWNVSTRPSTARGGYGRSVERTARWIGILRQLLTIVPETTATFALWAQLVEQHRVIGARVHDAHLVAIMQSHSISELLTLNADDFRRFSGIKVTLPTEIRA